MEFAYNEKTREMEYRDLPPEMKEVPCLEDREILELTKSRQKDRSVLRLPPGFGVGDFKKPSISRKRVPRSDKAGKRVEQEKKESVLGQKSGLQMLIERATTPTKVKL